MQPGRPSESFIIHEPDIRVRESCFTEPATLTIKAQREEVRANTQNAQKLACKHTCKLGNDKHKPDSKFHAGLYSFHGEPGRKNIRGKARLAEAALHFLFPNITVISSHKHGHTYNAHINVCA